MKKVIRVAIIGSPNVGKSSLLNSMIGKKNSITSPTPHTTRDAILGIINVNDTQIIFMDTPGYIRKASSIWADHFTRQTISAIDNCDAILLMIDASKVNRFGTQILLKELASHPSAIVLLNKIDTRSKEKLYPIVDDIVKNGYQDTVFLVSARTGEGVSDLLEYIKSKATEKEWEFSDNTEVELSKERYGAECVREKIFYCIQDEIPFGIDVIALKWSFRKNKNWELYAQIIVEKESHKGILIGAKGAMIKKISSTARAELESIWGAGQLFVDVAVGDKNEPIL